MPEKRKSKKIIAGSLTIGGGAPVSIQSMTSLPVEQYEATIAQIKRLEALGVELVRVALRNEGSAEYLNKILPEVSIPVCADIHFNYKIAIKAIRAGIHKIRINPGNIGSEKGINEIVSAARDNHVPVRIGVNGGSLDRKKYPDGTAGDMVASALEHIRLLEDRNFTDIVVSLKSSDIMKTISANQLFAEKRDYPLHIGLTEAGYGLTCTIQSSIVLGHLLLQGIGDTLRVSMTGDPEDEVIIAKKILETVGERKPLITIISCPTCGRTSPDLDILSLAQQVDTELAARFESLLSERGMSLTVAVMGCEVNGPGEAAHADVGLAGIGDGKVLLFARNKKLQTLKKNNAVEALIEEVTRLISQ